MTQKHKPNCMIYLCTCMPYPQEIPQEKEVFCRERFKLKNISLCEACKNADEMLEKLEKNGVKVVDPPPEDSL